MTLSAPPPAEPKPPTWRRRVPGVGLDTGRIAALSDGVFAVAITLLALDIRLPDSAHGADVTQDILALWPKYLTYAISFLVIGTFWIAHHRMFEFIERYDSKLVWLNIFTLMFVSFIPFPTDVVGEHRVQTSTVVLYALTLGCTSLLHCIMWWYASRGHRLVAEDLPDNLIRLFSLRLLLPTIIFFSSIGVAFLSPDIAQWTWLLIFPVTTILKHDLHSNRFDAALDA